jgi:cyanophycinase
MKSMLSSSQSRLIKLGVSLALSLCVSGIAQAGKLFISGGKYDDKNTALFVDGLRKATGKDTSFAPNINSTSNCSTNWSTTSCPRIAVVTASKVDYATGLDAFNNDVTVDNVLKRGFYNLFQTHGFSPKFITAHVDNYTTHAYSGYAAGDANIALINQADVVWFAGGDQSKIARTFLNNTGSDSPLAAALRARWSAGNVVIAGDSAGNHIVNSTMHGAGVSYGYVYYGADLQNKAITDYTQFGDTRDGSTALRYFDNGVKMKGLGFIPAGLLTDTHFDARSGRLGRLVAALKSINVMQGLGVDENTGILINDATREVKVYGAGTLIIADMAGATYQTGSFFKVTGVRVSLLTAGDSYNYQTKVVASTKAAITSPYYSSYYDSPDIFAAFETSKSLTRLVDQSSASNIGTAPRPVYSSNPQYPSTAPAIKLKFTKDSQTKGYYSSGKYTVVKALVQIL